MGVEKDKQRGVRIIWRKREMRRMVWREREKKMMRKTRREVG